MSNMDDLWIQTLSELASGLSRDLTLGAIAERGLAVGRSLGSGSACITLRARPERGLPLEVALGDALASFSRIDVPISSRRVEGVLSWTGSTVPTDGVHVRLLASLIAIAAERASLASALHESVLERRELVTKVAHDIRTPLQSFSLGMDAVRAARGSELAGERVSETLERMARSVVSLGHIVDDVEDTSLAYDAAMVLRSAGHAPDSLVLQACAMRASAAVARGSSVAVETSRIASVVCDGARIARSLSSLVDNGLRYSPRGSTVTLRVVTRPDRVRFEVEDDGPGIAAAVRERIIVQPFRGKSTARVGFGLYLASTVALAHGGILDLSAERSRGVTFGLEIPRQAPPARDGTSA